MKSFSTYAKLLFIVIASFQYSASADTGNNTWELLSECPATEFAWHENVTPENFDLYWEEVPTGMEYQVEVYVDGLLNYSEYTGETNAHVDFSVPLEPGNSVEYFITTICQEGNGNTFSNKFNIIATVDVVMGMNVPPNDIECRECPFVLRNIPQQGGLYNFYDCPCVNNAGWWNPQCEITSFSFNIRTCGDGDNVPKNNSVEEKFIPNPFSSNTSIVFHVNKPSTINLSIFDFNGKEVMKVVENEYGEDGLKKIDVNGIDLENGFYYYILKIGEMQKVGRLIKHGT